MVGAALLPPSPPLELPDEDVLEEEEEEEEPPAASPVLDFASDEDEDFSPDSLLSAFFLDSEG